MYCLSQSFFVINEYLLTLYRLTRHCQWKGRQKASTKDLVLFILTLFVCAWMNCMLFTDHDVCMYGAPKGTTFFFRFLEIIFRSLEIIFRSLEIIFRSLEILFRSLEIIFRSLEIIFRSLEILFCSLEILFPRNHSVSSKSFISLEII